MTNSHLRLITSLLLTLAFWTGIKAEYTFEGGAAVNLGVGSSEFAPYFIHTNRFGKLTQSKNAQIDIWAQDTLDLSKRFDFAWGLEALAGYANKADYRRWDPTLGEWYNNPQGPAAIWLQQLFAEVKWRCLYLSVGLKDRGSCFVNQELSSGDLIWSGNSRGIPEARIGFVDFQNIPFTNKWVQFDVCLSYGKFVDTDWINNHFDYYSGKRNPGGYWTYKRASLRTNPDKPFSFQAGIQMVGIFGGYTYRYGAGELVETINNYNGFKDFVQILFPFWSNEREGYRVGDTKGSWDFKACYRFKGGESLRAYVQWPWEDSSGIIKRNGFDGLWGLEFQLGRRWWISGAVAEYLDLTHMSGPFGYDPDYHNPIHGGTLPDKVGGGDGYYNNAYYRAYTNYGLNMGTPMVMGVLFFGNDPYNPENGKIPYFRVRGFHLALNGAIGPNCDYVVKYTHRKAWGDTNQLTLIHPVEGDSFMAAADYRFPQVPGLSLGAAIGIDHGTMPGNAVGGMLTLSYMRPFIFGK